MSYNRAQCPRCHDVYYLAEGCPCEEMTDEEVEEALERAAEAEIERHERSELGTHDEAADQAQNAWENWRKREPI